MTMNATPPLTTPLIEMRRVTKRYVEGQRDHAVLDEADLQIQTGELVVLLGRSGSGKSTLLNLLSGIDLPTSGEILFEGTDLGALSEHERTLLRRHQIGFVFQFMNLVPTLTVEENILLPLELAGRLNRTQRDQALERLDFVGLGDRRTSYPDVLSGGEQQRVSIARALAHEPHLVLADEPTGNLDGDTEAQVLELLEKAVRESERTLVMATHSLEVAALADRVLRVQHGQLVEVDPSNPN